MAEPVPDIADVLVDALIAGKGYTREAAHHTVDEIVQDANAYGQMSDAVNDLIVGHAPDQDLWDGEEDQTTIMVDFLDWLPDMVLHHAAEKIRAMYPGSKGSEQAYRREEAASVIDPFYFYDGTWRRKANGAEVPDRVIRSKG